VRLANAMLAAAAVLLVVVAPAAAAGQAQGAAGTILFTSGNDLGVENGPRRPTVFKLGQTTTITSVLDYHWNGGRGAAPGEIALRRAEDGKQFGPWQAVAQQPALPVNWIVYPHLTVKPGTYTILDSDPATWAQNAASGNRGMSFVRGFVRGETTAGASVSTIAVTTAIAAPEATLGALSGAGANQVLALLAAGTEVAAGAKTAAYAPPFGRLSTASVTNAKALASDLYQAVDLRTRAAVALAGVQTAYGAAAAAANKGDEKTAREQLAIASAYLQMAQAMQAALHQLALQAKAVPPLRAAPPAKATASPSQSNVASNPKILSGTMCGADADGQWVNPSHCAVLQTWVKDTGNSLPRYAVFPYSGGCENENGQWSSACYDWYERALNCEMRAQNTPGFDKSKCAGSPYLWDAFHNAAPPASTAPANGSDEKAEEIALHQRNIGIIQSTLDKDKAALANERDPARRAELQRRILGDEADLGAERDLIASIETGKDVHTRTAYDDYAHDLFVQRIRDSQAEMLAALGAREKLEHLVALAPPDKQETVQDFIDRHAGTIDVTQLRAAFKAVSDLVGGEYEQEAAKENERAVQFDDYLKRAENVKTIADYASSVGPYKYSYALIEAAVGGDPTEIRKSAGAFEADYAATAFIRVEFGPQWETAYRATVKLATEGPSAAVSQAAQQYNPWISAGAEALKGYDKGFWGASGDAAKPFLKASLQRLKDSS